ncbi:peptide-N(4)-(N-acetyl-beta-glucosaminyl)asparagine amidase-like [Convolutriloba macropyga]|uniref:peptide-N(4)-(N-acetyl-beta- glucosaminyl)asparagine amidase-like n=1 Tax=Convolutriloba macropyga TaxID=536237 RepID=UPI003F5283F3
MNNLTQSELNLQHKLEKQWRHFIESYENEESKKTALATVPLVKLTTTAQRKFLNREKDCKLTIKEFLFLELLRWFKLEFFEWVDALACESCGGKTLNRGMLQANNEELRYGALRVENHFCANCQMINRFPRYNCPVRLLTSRRGRCGEWANCFVLLCRACNFETRYVLDETDHVWAEVFCDCLGKRWVHADPCENDFDKPLLYEKGWKKKLTYIFSVSSYEIVDSTWRYSHDHQALKLRRTQYREPMVHRIITNLNTKIKQHNYGLDWGSISRRLITEYIEFLNNDSRLNSKLNGKKIGADELQGRTTGSVEWRRERGELGDVMSAESNVKSHIFQIKGSTSVPNVASLTYCPVEDMYTFRSSLDDVNPVILYGWDKGVEKYENIFRKEEFDWKMVYLSRNSDSEEAKAGKISWRFSPPKSGSVKFNRIEVKLSRKLYEDAKVLIALHTFDSEGKRQFIEELSSADDDDVNSVDLRGKILNDVMIVCDLSGGRGDVYWQHAQLFRQSINEPGLNPFHVKLHYST